MLATKLSSLEEFIILLVIRKFSKNPNIKVIISALPLILTTSKILLPLSVALLIIIPDIETSYTLYIINLILMFCIISFSILEAIKIYETDDYHIKHEDIENNKYIESLGITNFKGFINLKSLLNNFSGFKKISYTVINSTVGTFLLFLLLGALGNLLEVEKNIYLIFLLFIYLFFLSFSIMYCVFYKYIFKKYPTHPLLNGLKIFIIFTLFLLLIGIPLLIIWLPLILNNRYKVSIL